jgi:amidophosphoribosyltransferase
MFRTLSASRTLIDSVAQAQSDTFATQPAGEVSILEAQPFLVTCQHGQIAVCHNGNLPFAKEERERLEREGAIFSSTSDTEVVLHGVARSSATIREAIPEVLSRTEGAFSMLFLTPTELIAIRDSRGFRPLALGRLGDAWVIASETCAFDLIDAQYIRDVEPGEMIVIDQDGLRSSHPLPENRHSMCLFEHVYFARPDSLIYGKSINQSRHKMGRRLGHRTTCRRRHCCPRARFRSGSINRLCG